MGLSLDTRHTSKCGKKSRRFRRCPCPVWVEGTEDGDYVRKSLDFTSIEAAEAVVFEWKGAARSARKARSGRRSPSRSRSFWPTAARVNLAEATVLLYRRFLEGHLVPWCNFQRIEDLRRLDVDTVPRCRESWKWAAVTSARRLERLRTFFTFCVDSGITDQGLALVRGLDVHVQPMPKARLGHLGVTRSRQLRRLLEAVIADIGTFPYARAASEWNGSSVLMCPIVV